VFVKTYTINTRLLGKIAITGYYRKKQDKRSGNYFPGSSIWKETD
jgi:hypothetical protein